MEIKPVRSHMPFLYISQKLLFALWLTGTLDPRNFSQDPVLHSTSRDLGI